MLFGVLQSIVLYVLSLDVERCPEDGKIQGDVLVTSEKVCSESDLGVQNVFGGISRCGFGAF